MRAAIRAAVLLRLLALAASAMALGTAACGGEAPDARVAFAVSASSGGAGALPTPGTGRLLARETSRERFASAAFGECPDGMASVGGRFCIDRYEASLVEVLPDGREAALAPFGPTAGKRVRAVSRKGVFPQGYVSAVEAGRACGASGKRLCRVAEWTAACKGPEKKAWGYGERRVPGTCNDRGKNPVVAKYGFGRWNWSSMNDAELNQLGQTLAKTGMHEDCTNGYGVFDMVGNLHEWVADPDGTFYGGYYADVASVGHGEGCGYVTTAHEARYHDYSTGFRCCSDPN